MSQDYEVYTLKVFDEVALSQNGSVTSEAIDLTRKAENWRFSAQYYFTSAGAATLKLEVLVSCDGINFVDTDSDIGASLAKSTHDVIEFDPTHCRYIKIKATEENVAAITACTVTVAIS